MTTLRLTPSASLQFNDVKAEFDRIARALSGGMTTTEALVDVDQRLAGLRKPLAVLQMALRNEAATAKERERLDRPADKAPAVPMRGAAGLRVGHRSAR